MSTSPSAKPAERRLSAIDLFCMQTYQTAEVETRHVRVIASTLGVVCLMLFLCLGAAVWRANAIEHQRDALAQELSSERAARIKATLAVRDVEMNVANYALDTQVRRDIVDDRMLLQERRSIELERLAQSVEREKLVKADCVTPRSILSASGL